MDILNEFLGDVKVKLRMFQKKIFYWNYDQKYQLQSLNRVSGSPSIYLDVNDLHVNNAKSGVLLSDNIKASHVENFYVTCNITKSSSTMAKCSELLNDNFLLCLSMRGKVLLSKINHMITCN